MAFGEILTNLRKSKGLSQEQLAAKFNLTRQTISKWELNQSTPDISYLVQLSDYFCVTTDYLLKGKQRNTITNDDKNNIESEKTAYTNEDPIKANICKWCVLFGAITMGVSLIGIIAFVICSALHPWGVLVDNKMFDGLIGFLIGSKTIWFFILLIILCVTGFIISAYGIIKAMMRNR